MENEKELTILKWVVGVVYSLIAVLAVFFIITFIPQNANASTKKSKEAITVSIPASVAKTSRIKIEVVPSNYQVNPTMEVRKDYITNLRYYNGNIDFEDVYEEAEYWCKEYGINLNFLLALIYVESKYQNGVVSYANCVGLCQLGRDAVDQFNTAMWKSGSRKFYTFEDVQWDWRKNIEVACWYLDWLWTYRASYTTNTRTYIQSYNYGRTGVKNAIQKNEFTYADAIIKYRDELNRL